MSVWTLFLLVCVQTLLIFVSEPKSPKHFIVMVAVFAFVDLFLWAAWVINRRLRIKIKGHG